MQPLSLEMLVAERRAGRKRPSGSRERGSLGEPGTVCPRRRPDRALRRGRATRRMLLGGGRGCPRGEQASRSSALSRSGRRALACGLSRGRTACDGRRRGTCTAARPRLPRNRARAARPRRAGRFTCRARTRRPRGDARRDRTPDRRARRRRARPAAARSASPLAPSARSSTPASRPGASGIAARAPSTCFSSLQPTPTAPPRRSSTGSRSRRRGFATRLAPG